MYCMIMVYKVWNMEEIIIYNYLIFDIDGTLLDTEFAVLSSLQRIVKEELNKDMSFEDLYFALGIPGEITLEKLGIANVKQCADRWNEYLRGYFRHIKVFDGIKEVLEELHNRGSSMGIVTSKTREEYANDFIPFGIDKYFDIVVCADDTEIHKPYPEPILKFIELSGAEKEKTVYIGDTEYDMKCAKDAGVDFALALWGAKTDKGIKPDYIVERPIDILNIK